ncbi:MAG: hypothetical protein FWG10_11085 [Eubacteriaceae bacterium]|nr:hypothetical protein [Eubacteriaceae bacterium]
MRMTIHHFEDQFACCKIDEDDNIMISRTIIRGLPIEGSVIVGDYNIGFAIDPTAAAKNPD